jgi:hypothetical protein
MVLGDDAGHVHIITFLSRGDFESFYGPPQAIPPLSHVRHAPASHVVTEGSIQMSFADFVAGPLVQHISMPVHGDWVRSVRCGGVGGSFLSCSSSPTSALAWYDPATLLDARLRIYRCQKGVCAIDYNSVLNVIASGSRSGEVNTWSPHVADTHTACLRSCTGPVVAVAVRDVGQLISVSEEGAVYVWDLSSNG